MYFLRSLLSGILSKWVIVDFSVCIIEALKINNEKRSINCFSDFFLSWNNIENNMSSPVRVSQNSTGNNSPKAVGHG